jgi:hypothetical protein
MTALRAFFKAAVPSEGGNTTSASAGAAQAPSGGANAAHGKAEEAEAAEAEPTTGLIDPFAPGADAKVLKFIRLTSPATPLAFGEKWQLQATGIYTDKSEEDLTRAVAWSSSAPDVVAVDPQGNATAASKAGQAQITALDKASGVSSYSILDVTRDGERPEPELQALTIEPASATIGGGWQQKFGASGKTADGKVYPVFKVVWSSSADDVVTIDQHGRALAQRKSGTATITATEKKSGLSASAKVTVQWDEATSQLPALKLIRLTMPAGPLVFGGRQYLKAHGIYADKSEHDLTNTIAWSSSDPEIATIDKKGRVTAGTKAGSAQITATDPASGVSSSGMVTVVAP